MEYIGNMGAFARNYSINCSFTNSLESMNRVLAFCVFVNCCQCRYFCHNDVSFRIFFVLHGWVRSAILLTFIIPCTSFSAILLIRSLSHIAEKSALNFWFNAELISSLCLLKFCSTHRFQTESWSGCMSRHYGIADQPARHWYYVQRKNDAHGYHCSWSHHHQYRLQWGGTFPHLWIPGWRRIRKQGCTGRFRLDIPVLILFLVFWFP